MPGWFRQARPLSISDDDRATVRSRLSIDDIVYISAHAFVCEAVRNLDEIAKGGIFSHEAVGGPRNSSRYREDPDDRRGWHHVNRSATGLAKGSRMFLCSQRRAGLKALQKGLNANSRTMQNICGELQNPRR